MTVQLSTLTFDCADAAKLAAFWASVVGASVTEDSTDEYAGLDGVSGPSWSFARVPEPKTAKNRLHVDLVVDDLDGEVDRVIALGASVVGTYGEAPRWTTLRDIEGNEFCLVAG